MNDDFRDILRALPGDAGAVSCRRGVRVEDLASEGTVVQIGLAPRRVDLLTSLTGVTFPEAREERVEREVDGLRVPFVGLATLLLATLLKNKRAVGRRQDLADVHALEAGTEGKAPPPKD